ncbi:MAG: sulfite exporter TauE/SafE family protein [Lachnospiraceae bacterium]|nr:sulfite exporter TauE/SafE family protein [Lachnospiraceae bacterium]
MGFQLDIQIPLLTVFLQGLISFFSPCVLPLLPVYIGYLSGGTLKRDDAGNLSYDRRKVFINTVFFVIGISFAFFLLGLGAAAIGTFFRARQMLFVRIGGILLILFGLMQLHVLELPFPLLKERRLPFSPDRIAMSPLTALLLGFTFSFAWTPCVGPTLAGVLIVAASAATKAKGFSMIVLYTLGFILPFLATGLFATGLLALFQKNRNLVRYAETAGGILMILMGIMLYTGKLNTISGYLSTLQ